MNIKINMGANIVKKQKQLFNIIWESNNWIANELYEGISSGIASGTIGLLFN